VARHLLEFEHDQRDRSASRRARCLQDARFFAFGIELDEVEARPSELRRGIDPV